MEQENRKVKTVRTVRGYRFMPKWNDSTRIVTVAIVVTAMILTGVLIYGLNY